MNSGWSTPRRNMVLWLAVITLATFTLARFTPPTPVSATASPHEFSAERALTKLEVIAQHPHPVASNEHANVRDFLLQQLTLLGLTPQLQNVNIASESFGTISGAFVENIVARIAGHSPTKAVALFAHYDSVPGSRAANDDGAGVVTLLEAARAILAGERLANDVILVFTDAEEIGLLGARAFVEKHPWAKDIGLFLNFEARGSSGPSTMFRTSPQNDFLIDGFARAVPHPVTNSLISSLATILPNDTDFTVLSKYGVAGYDFAYAGGLDRYHSYRDSVENLDLRSLQHHGSNALALTREFGNADLTIAPSHTKVIYFDLFQWFVVYYPELWGSVFGLAIALVFCVAFFKTKKLFRASALYLLAIVAGALSVFLLKFIMSFWKSDAFFVSNSTSLIGPFLLVSFAAFQCIQLFLGKTLTRAESFAGAHLAWVILGVVTGILLPGTSYIFHWPVFFSLLGYLIELRYPHVVVLKFIAIFPATVMLTGLCYMVFVLEGGAAPYVTATAFGILLSILAPIFYDISRTWRWRLALGALATSVAVHLLIATSVHHTELQPLPTSLVYGLDADAKAASFLTNSHHEKYWPRSKLTFTKTASLPVFYSRQTEVWQAPAPLIDLPSPELAVLAHHIDPTSGFHMVKMKVASRRQAACIAVWEESMSILKEIWVNEEKIISMTRFSPDLDKLASDAFLGARNRSWEVWYCNIPEASVTIEAHLESTNEPKKLRVMDLSYGLLVPHPPRESDTISSPFSDRMIVSKSFTIDVGEGK